MMTLFKHKIKTIFLLLSGAALLTMSGCKKGTFDINDPNPNQPSTVPPKFSLSDALAGTASLMLGGNTDMFNNWMGYWSQSGDYTPSPTFVYYQVNTDTYSGNWDNAYLNLINYKVIIDQALKDSTLGNYKAVAMIMKAFVYQRIVDIYNNAPYSDALTLKNFTPDYTDAQEIYKSLVNQIDSAITLINNPDPNAETLDQYDAMFAGDMDKWKKFGNTLKLKILLRQTEVSGG
ncbi:MAG TPA: SusD/RagB family nutrient-binding outer membrane lipoprotein, partial [Puia sp.]|nr:SusD/RagB family nutrient-binding outer membrane lipoprotein [Puia sp.]